MLDDCKEVLDGDLVIPIGEHTFRVKQPSAREGIRLQVLAATEMDDATEAAEVLKLLGPVWDEMAKAGIPRTHAAHAGRTALLHYIHGFDLAERYWSGGLEGDDSPNPYPPQLIRKPWWRRR